MQMINGVKNLQEIIPLISALKALLGECKYSPSNVRVIAFKL